MTGVTQADDVAVPSHRRRRLLSLGLRLAVIVAIAGGLVWSVSSQWPEVERTWKGLAWQSIVLAVLAVLGGMFANSMAWRAATRDIGHAVSIPDTLRILLIGQLGKYIPGSVWAYVLQVELGKRAGLPRARAFVATLVALGLGIVAALGLGLLSLPSLLHAASANDAAYAGPVRVALIIAAAMFPIAVICAIPPVLTWLIQVVLRTLRRPPLPHALTGPGVLRVLAWSVLGYVLFGVQLWLLANTQAGSGVAGLVRSTGSFAIAMTAGMFAFVSPSGLGVREAVLVASLAPSLTSSGGVGVAIGIALASRLIFTLADLIGAGLAALSGTQLMRRRGGRAADVVTPVTHRAAEAPATAASSPSP
jgi:glycosyltransferase 2 family protein